MRSQEDHRALTPARLDVRRASSRLPGGSALLALILLAGCATPEGYERVGASETIIGRARRGDAIVLLTDAPALLFVDADRVSWTRMPLRPDGGEVFRPWGLGESGGRLFTVSAFDRLFEIQNDGRVVPVGKLARPVANVIDLENGMGAQPVGDAAGAPLLVALGATGALAPHASPLRAALGLTPAEESLLNLLSCSVPPRAICWLPVQPRIYFSGDALEAGVELEGVASPDAASLIDADGGRVFEDALVGRDGDVIVLRNRAGSPEQVLSRFTAAGTWVADRRLDEPLRMLVTSVGADDVLGVSRAGRLVVVR